MKNDTTILVIDDERPIRKLLEITLKSVDYIITEAGTAREGLLFAAMHPPDLILLDLGLPDEDGQSVLIKLREWYLSPIIILSVRNSEDEIIKALDNGANDYLVKPFRTGELIARIRNALRMNPAETTSPRLFSHGLVIDFSTRTVRKNDNVIKLTSTEYSLLTLLARHEGRVLTHQYILKEIWGPGYIEQSQNLRVFIASLRKKIEDDPNLPTLIITESGIGYRFVTD